jgi:DNA-binding transcriptional MocR family regulator
MHNGSSGCLENVCKAFIGPGDIAIVESPSYSGTVRAIRGFQADVIEVPMDKEGINPDLFRETVESLVAEGKRVKLFYTIPDYHNPMGNVTTLEIRKAILEICAKYKILIAEDAAYTELYYDTPPPPSYYALSDGHGVIKMCSFSKILATGLRSGWIQARDELAEPLTKVRFDMGNSPLVHYALADLIESGKLDAHIISMRNLYKSKCRTMIDSLRKYCGPYVELDEPEGGYFLWVKCTKTKAFDLIQAAAEEGVVFPLGSIFYVDSSLDDAHFRLAFTRAPFEHLEEASKRIGKAFEKVLDSQN